MSTGPTNTPTLPQPSAADQGADVRRDRLLPWIAAERTLRAIVLVVVGLVLVTHPHTNWANTITDLTRDVGLDPSNNGIQRIISKIAAISPRKYVLFGAVAIAYGALEGGEAYGLWRRRRWGEVLTVVATSVLFIPEIWELAHSVTLLKVGALLVNIAVVAYLLMRLRQQRH